MLEQDGDIDSSSATWISFADLMTGLLGAFVLLLVGVMAVAALIPLPFLLEVVVAMLLGGIINPLYSLLIALTNDHLQKEDMPGASAGLIFLNGFGAIFGPLVAGWLKLLGDAVATGIGASLLLAGDLGCLMNMAGKLQREGSTIRVRHVAEVLAGMGDLPAIGEPERG